MGRVAAAVAYDRTHLGHPAASWYTEVVQKSISMSIMFYFEEPRPSQCPYSDHQLHKNKTWILLGSLKKKL